MSWAIIGTVLPASPAAAVVPPPTLTLKTSGGIVRDNSVISSNTDMTVGVGGLIEEGTGPRELRIDLDATTVFQAGSVVAPEGWTVEYSTDNGTNWSGTQPSPASDTTNVRASASVTAGAVNGSSQLYTKQVTSPVPASTFSGSTGGDGWDVFFYDNYVLNIFHHEQAMVALDCHLRSTGARCPGFDPTQTSGAEHSVFSDYRAGDRAGGWVDGNTGRAYAFTADANTSTPGALCMDLNTAPPTNCGFVALSTATNLSNYSYLSNAEGINGRLFGIDLRNKKLLCYDPLTNAPCASSPVSLAGSNLTNSYYHVLALGTKVFASTDTSLNCVDSATLSPCAGSWPVTYSSLSWTAKEVPPIAHLNTSGVLDGVCLWNGCLDLSGAKQAGWTNPHSVTPWASDAGNNLYAGEFGKFAVTAGRAFMFEVLASANPAVVYCFDYTTNAACSGFTGSLAGVDEPYALVADPTNPGCVWFNSHPGTIGLFDATTGANQCSANPVITLLPSAFAPRFVCTSSGGIDRWTSLKLNSVSGGTPASQTLTVRTGNGDPVAGWVNKPITVGQTLSLADLAVADTGARPTFNVAFSGVSGNLTSADLTINYEGRGPELCLDIRLDNTKAPGGPNCPVIQTVTGHLTQNVSGQVTAATPQRTFTVSGSNIACPQNIIYAGPPGPVRDLAATSPAQGAGTITFKAPTDDGGSPIRWYEVSTDGGTTWSVVSEVPDGNGVITHAMTGLTPGSTTFTVRSVNNLGHSTDSTTTTEVLATNPTTTTTTATPTTTPAPAPIPDGQGNIPDLPPGGVGVTDNGNPVTATVQVIDNTQIKVSTPDGVTLQLAGDCGQPCPVRTGASGQPYLVMDDTGRVRVFGSGFQPNSMVQVWMLPGTFLGSVPVGADGSFDQHLPVNASAGEHTIQVNGITQAGLTRSANLGLLVTAGTGSGALPYTGVSLWWLYAGVALLAGGGATFGVARVVGVGQARKEEIG